MSNKAATAIRRGGVRLRSSLGSGHSSLNLIVSEMSSLRQRLKDVVSAEQRVSGSQISWGDSEKSPALQDVLHHMNDITALWIETQNEYIAAMKEYKRVYEHILESEKQLDQARKDLATYEEKEKKYEKELWKGSKDPDKAAHKKDYYRRHKEIALAEVSGQERETEAVKLMSIKAGLLDHSRAWMTFGKKCCMFAEVQKELALLVPDISPQTDTAPSYTGTRQSTAIVKDLERRLTDMVPSYQASAGSRVLSPPSFLPPPRPLPTYQEQEYDSFDSFEEN